MTKVLFRVESGPNIGLGHVQRSLALAMSLKTLDVQSVFLLNEDEESHGWVREQGFQVAGLGLAESWSEADRETTSGAADFHSCEAVVVDCHEVGATYLDSLKNSGLYVIMRDDLALFPFPCQMVINGNADAEKLPYRSVTEDTSFLLGTRYIVLKEEFWNPVIRKPVETVGNVLLTLGGTDPYDLMPGILRLLDDVAGDFTVTAVVGPFFQNAESVQEAARNAKRSVEIVSSPRTIYDLMIGADMAISAAGQTIYELAAVGCPTIAVSLAANQQGQSKALAEAGVLSMAGDATSDGDVVAAIGRSLESLLSDPEAREKMTAIAQNHVGGQGAHIVAKAIVEKIPHPNAIRKSGVACT